MRVSDEPRVDVLRQKAAVLESENERLIKQVGDLLREVWTLKGMPAEALELNLPELKERAAGRGESPARSGSERRPRGGGEKKSKDPQKGHGPTKQPELEHVERTYEVEPEQRSDCALCGLSVEDWKDGNGEDIADESEVVRRIPPKWVVERSKRKKCRCPNGCTIVTAKGPPKLIPGGRYTLDVALSSTIEKFIDHIPLERQARMALRLGMRITSQALWDQQLALARLLEPLVRRIKLFILTQPVIGADLSPFKLIKKGGSLKWQVWQLSCPQARYFEILGTKKAAVGRCLFEVRDDDDELVLAFEGEVMADGAAEIEKVAELVGFRIANCWGHARRNVLKADGEAPAQVCEFLDLVGKLYEIERDVAGVDADVPGGYRRHIHLTALARARDTRSRQVTSDIKQWIEAQKCVPGGVLQKQLRYVATRWTSLTRFLDDPRIPLDNNQTEGGFVGLAHGRRNYIGCRSKLGTRVAAVFYTLFESARVQGADGAAYITYAAETALDGGEPLLPHQWLAKFPDSS